jgi:uncharacterized caspase-like protein
MNLHAHMKKFYGFFLVATLLLICQPASATKRVALVVGNSHYKNAAVLANPANDAAAIAATLKGAGFDIVDSRLDLQSTDMRRALRDFADQARDADIAVVYYAGHGMEIDGTNYLIPTDARLERDTDIYDEAFSLDRVLLAIEPAKQLRLVIVDACRNNPFADTMKRTVSSRTVSRGLARVEPSTSNTLVAFAAKAGLTALDGTNKTSPYAEALVKYIATPGLDLRRAFGFVRDDVLQATGNRQEPYVYGSLGGEDFALVPAPKPAASAPAAGPDADIRRDYELAMQVGNRPAMNAFLGQHPDGFYASLAKLQLEKIEAEEATAAAAERSRLAEQERARLAAEGAKKETQAKADAEAKAAEVARIAAEKTQQVAQQQAAEGERQRTQKVASISANPVVATNNVQTSNWPDAPATVPAPAPDKATNVASLSDGAPHADIAKSVQSELRRVGCLKVDADGDSNETLQRSVTLFNRYAKTRLDTRAANTDTLDAIKQQPSRVCPPLCEHGFKADGDHCTKIVCAEGSFLNDDNECEKRRGRSRVVRHDYENRRDRADRYNRFSRERPGYDADLGDGGPARQRASVSGSGQIVCDRGGCRPVAHGCHLEFRTTAQGGPYEGGGGNVQICH